VCSSSATMTVAARGWPSSPAMLARVSEKGWRLWVTAVTDATEEATNDARRFCICDAPARTLSSELTSNGDLPMLRPIPGRGQSGPVKIVLEERRVREEPQLRPKTTVASEERRANFVRIHAVTNEGVILCLESRRCRAVFRSGGDASRAMQSIAPPEAVQPVARTAKLAVVHPTRRSAAANTVPSYIKTCAGGTP